MNQIRDSILIKKGGVLSPEDASKALGLLIDELRSSMSALPDTATMSDVTVDVTRIINSI